MRSPAHGPGVLWQYLEGLGLKMRQRSASLGTEPDKLLQQFIQSGCGLCRPPPLPRRRRFWCRTHAQRWLTSVTAPERATIEGAPAWGWGWHRYLTRSRIAITATSADSAPAATYTWGARAKVEFDTVEVLKFVAEVRRSGDGARSRHVGSPRSTTHTHTRAQLPCAH